MELVYREAKKKDLKALVSLLASDRLGSQREDNSSPVNHQYVKAFESIDGDPNNELIVVKLTDEIVGMLQLTFIQYLTHTGSLRCLIEGVRIHENYRGRGIGEQMFQYAISSARKRGCTLVQLTSDKQRKDAIRFYEKLGFVATHEGFKLNLSSTARG